MNNLVPQFSRNPEITYEHFPYSDENVFSFCKCNTTQEAKNIDKSTRIKMMTEVFL